MMQPKLTFIEVMVHGLVRVAYLLGLSLLLVFLWQNLLAARPRQTLLQAIVRVPAGESILLGRRELAAPAADTHHIRVSRDAKGVWAISNLSDSKAVEVRGDGRDKLLRTSAIKAGQIWTIGQDQWIASSTAPVLAFKKLASSEAWTFDGTVLQRSDGDAPLVCPDASLQQRLRRMWNKMMPLSLRRSIRLEWGGSVACDSHLPLSNFAPGDVWIARDGADYVLRATPDAARRVCPQTTAGTPCSAGASLFEQSIPFNNVTRLVVGRTHFAVSTQSDQLVLDALERTQWLPMDANPPVLPSAKNGAGSSPMLQWSFRGEDFWSWPLAISPLTTLALAGLALAGLVALIHVRRWGSTQLQSVCMAVAVVATFVSLLTFRTGAAANPLGVGVSLALVSCALVSVTFLPVRSLWAWGSYALMSLMVVAGLATQLQLGLQAADIGGWRYFQKTAALASFAITCGFSIALTLLSVRSGKSRIKPWRMHVLEWALVVLAVAALALLAVQAIFGGEEGVFGIQPVELAKLGLVLFSAHVLALRLEWDYHKGWHRLMLWGRFIVPILLFIALGAIALLLLRDYSPLVLMLGWLIGAMVAWSVASGRVGGALLALTFMGGGLALANWAHGDGVQWLQEHGFYGDRFAVWVNLGLHPHSGEQFSRATQVLAQGGWCGNVNASAWRIPAVQDDMAPAFFAGRFGAQAVCALLAVQGAYIGCLLMLGWCSLCAVGPGDAKGRWWSRFVFFSSWGFALLFASHLVLSWGTNFGFLPIMGQPMPLLSAGGSIIIMLLAPLQAIWLVPLQNPRDGVR